jgi:hypothetical protein
MVEVHTKVPRKVAHRHCEYCPGFSERVGIQDHLGHEPAGGMRQKHFGVWPKELPDTFNLMRAHTTRHQSHTPAYISIREHGSAYAGIRQQTLAYASIR